MELTIALHTTFNLPEDKLIWDVGHQSYTHKILTGRMADFDELRQYGGLSGFPKRKESPSDSFDTGHSSTSISAGLGIALCRDLKGLDYKAVSYTHLDVYKRQVWNHHQRGGRRQSNRKS